MSGLADPEAERPRTLPAFTLGSLFGMSRSMSPEHSSRRYTTQLCAEQRRPVPPFDEPSPEHEALVLGCLTP